MVVLRKDFALKGIKSSWRNADSSLSWKIKGRVEEKEKESRGHREDQPPELKEVPVPRLCIHKG